MTSSQLTLLCVRARELVYAQRACACMSVRGVKMILSTDENFVTTSCKRDGVAPLYSLEHPTHGHARM